MREKINVRPGPPRAKTPLDPGVFIHVFPGGPDRGIRNRGHLEMLFLGIAQGTGEQIGQPSLPSVLPQVERQDLDGGSSQAIQTNGRKHA